MLGGRNGPPYLRPYGPQEPSPRALASLVGGTDLRPATATFPHAPLCSAGVTSGPDQRWIKVLVDDNRYTDKGPESMFVIAMRPDESVGPPPDVPNPASLLTLRGSYLAAIGVCGELPWIYSKFAAGNNYYRPGSGGYEGPLVFASGWYCEDQVSKDRRTEDG